MARNKKVDDYIEGLAGWQKEIVMKLRQLVHEAAPEVKKTFKWSQPTFEVNGPICYTKAFTNHVNFGFWRGMDLEDPRGLLKGTGKNLRHIKINKVGDIKPQQIKDLIRQAADLDKG